MDNFSTQTSKPNQQIIIIELIVICKKSSLGQRILPPPAALKHNQQGAHSKWDNLTFQKTAKTKEDLHTIGTAQ